MKTKKITEVPLADLSKEASLVAEIDEELRRVPSSHFRRLVEDEKARAEAAERAITGSLGQETMRAVNAEQGIADSLAAETARAIREEGTLLDAIGQESGRAVAAERALGDGIDAEAARATEAEGAVSDSLSAEVGRAKAEEKAIADSVMAEAARAGAREAELQEGIQDERARAEAAESSILDAITTNAPIWDDKYTRNEVDNKFSSLETAIDWKESVGTFEEIAAEYPAPDDGWTVNVRDTDYTYRYNGAEWVAISANAIPKATQGVDGLLSKEDKAKYDDAYSKRHTHENKAVTDKVTQAMLDKLAGIDDGANQYVHPDTAGSRHIPSGGASGQILRWDADGTAVWGDPTGMGYTHPDSGAAAGTYRSVTVNAQGHVTAGTNPDTLAGYGITDAAGKSHGHDGTYVKRARRTLTLSAAGWSASYPFTQAVNAPGITANDDIKIIGLRIPANATAGQVKAWNKAAGCLMSSLDGVRDGSITFKAYKRPAVDFQVITEGG